MDAHKTQRMAPASVEFLERYHKHNDEFLKHIVRVTGDETNEQPKQRMHTYPKTRRKSLNKRLPARKLMKTVFWDRKGVLMVEFMQRKSTIKLELYCETLKELRRAIRNKRFGMLTTTVLVMLLHNNARYSHSSIAGTFQLGVVWPLFLQT
jgi:hypothetical protein